MMYRYLLCISLLAAVALGGCRKREWTVVEHRSTLIAVDSTADALADSAYLASLAPLRARVEAEMNTVIGRAAHTLTVGQPESTLSNFAADVFRQEAGRWLGRPVDLAVVNMGGLRIDVPEGDITVGRIFELMPFENELVVLWLPGDSLLSLCDIIARVGGEGVSGLRMGIRGGRAVHPTVGGRPIDPQASYAVATNDFLAEGNDRLTPLAGHTRLEHTGVKVRDLFIDHIRREAAQGRAIDPQLDGRISRE